MNKPERRTVLVLGGSKGIGAACVLEFLKAEYEVVYMARTRGVWHQQREEEFNQKIHYHPADFAKKEDLLAAGRSVQSSKTIHVLVNNAGGPPVKPMDMVTQEDFLASFQAHLFSFHEMARLFCPPMKEKGLGRIINILSITTRIPLAQMGLSNTIRGAVLLWAKTLSREWGPHGITVNNVLPGYTETERLKEVIQSVSQKRGLSPEEYKNTLVSEIPAGRLGRPEEIAKAVLFLAGQGAAYINGVSLPVDGGWTSCV